ncbi:hypothetical protein DM02DRAFT_734334 [Periconia macrospinosa]|uniref:NadR/Ttd14 AAA domain-containing protein n=1 Tax=Periconia macrospinosa TaxID=97972 RepID=A0A2V1D185_9PLEO|nr:hypothetical protein DM02DRAFT_734334 [Periconia macrospinosa]
MDAGRPHYKQALGWSAANPFTAMTKESKISCIMAPPERSGCQKVIRIKLSALRLSLHLESKRFRGSYIRSASLQQKFADTFRVLNITLSTLLIHTEREPVMEFHATDYNESSLNDRSKNKSKKWPNLYLIGPQCAGKTTLLEALRAYYSIDANRQFGNEHVGRPAIIEEVVRTVMHEKGFKVQDLKDPKKGFELQQCILVEQYNAEEISEDEWYISDRSGLDALVYAKVYVGVSAAEKLENTGEWNRLRKRMQDAVVVFCEAGNTDWLSDDEVRMAYNNTAEWERLNHEFHAMLLHYDIGHIILPKYITDLRERVVFIDSTLRMKSQRQGRSTV